VKYFLEFIMMMFYINFVTQGGHMARWTNNELKILKRQYSTKGSKYVAKRTGHPFSSVIIKAKELGLKSGAVKRWSDFELIYLRRNYPNKTTDSLKRSESSVINMVIRLKLNTPMPKKWSEEELNKLKELWTDKTLSIDEIAAKLNKTRPSAHFQAWKMGLRRPQVWRFWTKEETQYLKKNYKKKTYKQIADYLGMTTAAVFTKAMRTGLRVRTAPRAWTEAEDEFMRQNYKKIPTRELAEKMNRTYDSVITRAGLIGITRHKKSKE
jgi:hypothetical protein